MSDFSMIKASRLALYGLVLTALAGCAAPIKSRAELGGSSATVEGFQYFLTKSKISVAVAARLDDCGDKTALIRPVVTLLAATSKSLPVADTSAAFNVSPRDAWNLFRSIDTAQIDLTDDRRIASYSAAVTDKTVEVLAALVKVAGLWSPPSILSQSKEKKSKEQPQLEAYCTLAARELIAARNEATQALNALRDSRSLLLRATTASRGFAETLTAIDSAIEKQRIVIDATKARLTKSVGLNLTPAASESTKSDTQTIDLVSGWFEGISPDMITFVATIDRKGGLPDAGAASFDTAGAAGIFYRIPPAGVPVTLNATRKSASMAQLTVAIDGGSALEQATPDIPPEIRVGPPQPLSVSPVKVAQWGRLAIMPSDIGWLTSNSVKSSFDEWGVPKSASWTSTPASIAGLLGVASQADALLNKKAPAVDPTAEAKADLLLRLLKICKDADPTAVPAFCAGLTK